MSPTLQEILSVNDPRVLFFRELKGNDPRLQDAGVVLVEGDQQVRRLLKSALQTTTLFMEYRFYELFSELIPRDAICYAATREVMSQIVGYRLHQGVMALARRPPSLTPLELQPPVVVLHGLNDPENVGSIVRSAVCFGIRSILVDETSSDPYLRRSVRVSMGGAFEIQVAYTECLKRTLRELRKGMRIVAVEQGQNSIPLAQWQPREATALVFGNERRGVEVEVLSECDDQVEIPLAPTALHSLNVGAAAAILFERFHGALGGKR